MSSEPMNEMMNEIKGTATAANPDQAFFEQARRSLDEGCESLDGYTRSRLTSIRHEALAGGNRRPALLRWLPVTGIVTACSFLVVFSLVMDSSRTDEIEPVSDDALQNLDLLTAEEGLEFFEDYEFYQWLAENTPQA